jgi:dipeptidyl aminopeptidase/acylaminoacyl peptidase
MTKSVPRYLSVIAIVSSFLTASAAHTESAVSVAAKKDNLPRLPGAALLVGYPPGDLEITTEDKTSKLQEGELELILTPSISADGRIVASARHIAETPTNRYRSIPLVVSTYSMTDKKWTEYKDLQIRGGSVAISPDGSKVACSSMAGAPYGLHILDVKTGKVTVGPETADGAGSMSWSPDGRRIAFDRDGIYRQGRAKGILVLDVEAGTVSRIAEGSHPSWSPSGEWIAFDGYSPERGPDKGGGIPTL